MRHFGKLALVMTAFGTIILLGGIGVSSQAQTPSKAEKTLVPSDKNQDLPNDTTSTSSSPDFPINTMEIVTYDDLKRNYPIDLKNPSNVTTEVEYDYESGNYILHTKIGEMEINTPFVLSSEEYKRYTQQRDMQQYWNTKNAEATANYEDKFNITDMKFSLGPAEKLFGPGGVQVNTQGSAELTFAIDHNYIKNPSLSDRLKKTTIFDFDENIQMNVNASVGDRIKFGLNYNTEATFDFDQKKLKLGYEGKEDDIIQKIEVGNVGMQLNSSLITGSSSLFGLRTDLQFGKLKIQGVVSQQTASSQQVNTNGSVQIEEFEVPADRYDENRHFFLAQYFRDHYEQNMAQLPYISSGITINRIEVWITNKRNTYDQARNLICFSDLAETDRIDGPWTRSGQRFPSNAANNLYNTITNLNNVRQIDQFTALMSTTYPNTPGMVGGENYEKIESARLLTPSEYTLNAALGYISLNTTLNSDEVLAVAFEYTAGGQVYQIGEFSTDGVTAPKALIVKLLKGTSTSPRSAVWDLMMKNIYSLGASNIQQNNFKFNIVYRNDSAGVKLSYIPIGDIKDKVLLKVMNLDRLNAYKNASPDGKFDYIEGYTVVSSTGRIIFPVLEPFGSHLRRAIGNDALADKYVYEELYDSTRIMAQEYSEKNKFFLIGEYQGNNSSEIQLNAMNVPRGSVVVTAGGTQLTENVDYTVDYNMGVVHILNQSLLSSNTPIDVRLENQDLFNQQRKTLLGTHLEYAFSKDFSIGGTIMHLTEMPLYTKTAIGSEPIANTIWGLNMAYHTESQGLTRLIDRLPLLEATAPSNITFNAEFAHFIPGHRKIKHNPGYAYMDDFEATETTIDLTYPFYWHLASTPTDPTATTGFLHDGMLANDITYGKDRALFNWFVIDNNVFNLERNRDMPAHIRNNLDMRSNHLTRQVSEQEIYPKRETLVGESNYLSTLNVSYYPNERGPYNLDATDINPDGTLQNPTTRWGGMMRKLETSDFERANIEYIEFWLMDPFVNDTNGIAQGGDLVFNLGDISEDILKDGKKFFENGLSATGDTTQTTTTVWGRVPTAQSTVLAFSNDADARKYQDVGLNGLRTEDELEFPTYRQYINKLRAILTPTTIAAMENDSFSPLNDPAGDNYHHYRGEDYDAEERSILDRYKHYNGVEGNSPASDNGAYSVSATTVPDVEDLNQDNTLNEYEKYYQYRISLRPADMQVGKNHIAEKREVTIEMPNGQRSSVTWYQFKIPVNEYDSRTGSIRDFKSIRFMRLYLTNFAETTHLRFGTLQLVRGDWRTYTKPLFDPTNPPISNGSMDVSSVNIEENTTKAPVNYVLPPGVTRETDPGQPQLRQQNEQSMVLRVFDLAPGDARAVYKNINYDMRQYRRFQLFTHAEKMLDDVGTLADYDLSIFMRVGSDLKNNYYEYEIPLRLTPEGYYTNATADQVWPAENMFDFPLELFTQAKLNRNRSRKTNPNIALNKRYSETDPDKPNNHVTIIGNPNISDVNAIMIGIRNNSQRELKSGEIWVNEMRMTDYNEDGGIATLGNLAVDLSDIGQVAVSGSYKDADFAGLERRFSERELEDLAQFNFVTQFNFGRFFPEKAKVSIPLYFSYSLDNRAPKYNPLDQDVLLSDALASCETTAERDSIHRISRKRNTTTSVNLTNVRIDHRGKRPQLYDPANFSVSYAYTAAHALTPETERDKSITHHGSFNYNFATSPTPWEPFKKSKALNKPAWRIIKDFNLNYIPNSVAFAINIDRLYNETQLRDLEGTLIIDPHDVNNSLLSSSKSFKWNRNFEIRYDLSKSIQFSLRTATDSRIDETLYTPVNKKFFPTEFDNWKDTVLQSLRHLGTPLAYHQIFTAQWAVPLNKIPFLDWITANAQYNATYAWDYGAISSENINVGNIIANTSSWQLDGNLNFEKLYNKSKYLKEVQQRLSRNSNATTSNNRGNNATSKRNNFKPRIFNKSISLKKGQSDTIRHNLNSATINITFINRYGREVKIPYTRIDNNSITLRSKRNIDSLEVRVETRNPNQASHGQRTGDFFTRFLLMIRRGSISYRETSSLTVPGFDRSIGFMGQKKANNMLAPGLKFAFGKPGREFINDAVNRGWLFMSDSIINPATQNFSQDLDIKLNLEPIVGLKIDLNARYTATKANNIQYMFDGMPTQFTGTFQMTHVAIATTFWKRGLVNHYDSRAFLLFESNRQVIANRLQARYDGTRYPHTGFMTGHPLEGQTYNEANGGVSLNAPNVLIPAFFAAYSGRDINKTKTNIIPSLWSLLPNWKLSYDGLSRIPSIQKHFRSITLNHQYICTYNIGSYSSYANYAENDDGYGFIRDVVSGNPIPSSAYDVATVVLNESFVPFIGVDFALKNGLTFKGEYKQQRTISLNMASTQVVEATGSEYVFGVGYVLKDFDLMLKLKSNKVKKVKNDLTLRLDVGYKNIATLISKLDSEDVPQATAGSKTMTLKLTTDYVFSSRLNFRFFVDYQSNAPLITTSYPMSDTRVGMSVKFMLTR